MKSTGALQTGDAVQINARLNLYHLWGNGGCVSDDYVNDTPMQSDSYYGLCPDHPQTSCNSHDMFMNYMDYTNDECMNLFTEGQKNRMRALFSTGGPRENFAGKCLQDLGSLNLYIDGHDLVCSSNKTFELKNLPSNTCADIEWTKSTNLDVVSGQGTDSFTVKAKSTANGPGWVKATVSDDCGDEPITYNIDWVGKPNPSILGSDELYCGFSEWYFVDSDSYQWGDFEWSTDNNLDILSTTTGHKAEIEGLSEGWGQIFVEVTNSCGSKEERLVVWVNCFDFFLLPNPANDNVEIKLDDSKIDFNTVEEYEIKIYSSQQILHHSLKSKKMSNTINTSQLKNGTYFIQITYKGKPYTKQLVIQH